MFRTVIFVMAVISAYIVTANVETYSDKYDYIVVRDIIENERLRNQYYNCFMSTGPCVTADAKFFKDLIIEAVWDNCRKCTEKQKENLEFIRQWCIKNDPEIWKQALIASANIMTTKP